MNYSNIITINKAITMQDASKPLAYILGKTTFMGREFNIDERVYVPNPETEMLVQYTIDYIIRENKQKGVFLDVGTGSGNIAITLAKAFPEAQIYATDISQDALTVAQKNIEYHKINNIQLIHTDLVDDIFIEPDVVVANLPWGDDDHLLESNTKETVAYMPKIAIYAEDGIMGAYLRLCQKSILKQWNTTMIIETGSLKDSHFIQTFGTKINWLQIKIQHQLFQNYSIAILKKNYRIC